MIRELRASDAERVRELMGEFEWTFERDFMGALAYVDANDVPVMIVGAWRRAEIHMLTDSTWNTPAERFRALVELHEAMESGLGVMRVGRVITWLARTNFGRRLQRLGWQQTEASWSRRVNG